MALFTLEPDGRWSRAEELHEEYAYEPDELEESEPDESVTGWKSSVAANPVVSI